MPPKHTLCNAKQQDSMKQKQILSLLAYGLIPMTVSATELTDTLASRRNLTLNEVVVTGTRNATDIRHLPMTISTVGRTQLENRYQARQEGSAYAAYREAHKC